MKKLFQILIPLLILAGAAVWLVLYMSGAEQDKQADMLSSVSLMGNVKSFTVRTQGYGDFPTREGLTGEELKAEMDEIITFAGESGFNSVLFEARPGATTFYRSEKFPQSPALTGAKGAMGAFDPLDYLCKAGVKKRIQIYGLFNTLAAGEAGEGLGAGAPGTVEREGKRYFDPSDAATRQFLAQSTAEVARKYQVAGLVLGGMEMPGAATADLELLLKEIGAEVEKTAPGTPVGLIFDGTGESAITAELVRALTADGTLDMVVPRISATVDGDGNNYSAFLGAWAEAVEGKAKLYTGNQVFLLTQSDGAGYDDPEEVSYQLFLNSMNQKVAGAVLENYADLRSHSQETEMLMSFLTTTKNPLPDLGMNIPKTLNIAYPNGDFSTTDKSIFLMGTSDPKQEITINGSPLERISKGGAFGVQVQLGMGNNVFTFQQGERTARVVVNRYTPGVGTIKGITKNTLFPRHPYGVDSNEKITLSCVGPSGGKIAATLGGKTIQLTQTAATAKAGVPVVFKGTMTLSPDDYNPNVTASIGKVTYLLTYGGVNTTYQSQGETYVAGKNVQLVVENTGYISSILSDPDDDETVMGTLKAGATAYVEESVPTTRGGVATMAYKLRDSGGYILAGTASAGDLVKIREGAPAVEMTVSNISTMLDKNGDLILTLGEGTPAVTTKREGETLVLDCYHTTITADLGKASNGYIRSASIQEIPGGTRLTLKLEPGNQLWGYNLEYRDGKTVLYLKGAPAQSGTFGKPLEGVTVLLDPGHGGTDPGALGVAGMSGPTEAQLNLAVAYASKYRLEQLGATVNMTRGDESRISLDERCLQAEREKPDVFLSLHHNSSALTGDLNKARRMEVYYFEEASKPLAQALMTRLPPMLGRNATDPEYARFYVTRMTYAPAVLLELGFLVNPREYEECVDSINIFKTACGIAQSVLDIIPKETTFREVKASGQTPGQEQTLAGKN